MARRETMGNSRMDVYHSAQVHHLYSSYTTLPERLPEIVITIILNRFGFSVLAATVQAREHTHADPSDFNDF